MTIKDTRYLRMEFSPAEHRQVRLAAAIGDESMTLFARRAVLAAARTGAQQAYAAVDGDSQPADRQAEGSVATTAASANRRRHVDAGRMQGVPTSNPTG
jgi:hypothetical protein